MQFLFKNLLYSLLILLIGACDLFRNEQNVELAEIAFSKAPNYVLERFRYYQPGMPLIILSYGINISRNSAGIVKVESPSGENATIFLHSIYNISSTSLSTIIAGHEGRALVTIKDPDKERAFDPEVGFVTSGKTLARARQYFESREGVDITSQIIAAPVFALRLDDNASLIEEIRNMEFVQILEPDYGIRRVGPVNKFKRVLTEEQDFVTLMGILPTSLDGRKGMKVQPNDTITARYAQPDGTILRTITTIQN